MSAGQASVIAGGTSSFGQFRLTTFVDSTPKPSRTSAASPISRTASDETADPPSLNVEKGSTLTSSHTLEPFSQTLQPTSPALAQSHPGSAVATSTPAAEATTTHNGFGVLDLPPPLREGKLGPHRDGRVRNPVPRKLKGKTDDKNGNFAVMHMDMSGTGGLHSLPRGEAAQRTSENTAQAAKAANKDGYVPMKRRRVEGTARALQSVQDSPTPIPISDSVSAPSTIAQESRFFSALPRQETVHRTRVLTPEETKYEQARLLTLLRSISPLTVVDQVCKALAFFGGIPGAPPPDDRSFPESADANGSGALFVGWLSEIFPELDRKGWKPEVPKTRDTSRGKRPRGRPKGSKATKVRKDKGVKKGPKISNKGEMQALAPSLPQLKPALGEGISIGNGDEEWVDVVDTGDVDIQQEKNNSPENPLSVPKDSSKMDLLAGGQKSTSGAPISVDVDMIGGDRDNPNEPNTFGTSGQEFSPASLSIGKRRPGRPKGSRNRPRELDPGEDRRAGLTTPDIQTFSQSDNNSATTGQSRRRQRQPISKDSLKGTVLQDQTTTPTPLAEFHISSIQRSPALLNKRHHSQLLKEPLASTAILQLSGLTAEEQAVLEAFRTARAAQAANKPNTTGEKRKRAKSKSNTGVASSSTAPTPAIPSNDTEAAQIVAGPVSSQGNTSPQLTQNESPPILPPKRQRKPKDSNIVHAKKKTTQSTDTPTSAGPSPAAALKPASAVPEQMMPIARATAQGLEAHYEHFASLQQHKGDQQQQQQRPNLNAVSRSSPMQTTPTFYQQQPRHVPSPYRQQYPSHQPSHSHSYQSSLPAQPDSFRNANQQHTHSGFSPAQQQPTHHFSHFTDPSSFIDVPTLESVTNGTSNVNAYGRAIPRSTSNAGFGAGAQMRNGFEGLSDDMTERLLRDIRRQ
jgi:hypothetical protein